MKYALLILSLFCSCQLTTSNILDDPPIVASFVVGNPGAAGSPAVVVDTDGETLVGHASVDTLVHVMTKQGILLFEVRLFGGQRLVYSRSREYKETFELTDSIPAWTAKVLTPARIGQLGITFLPEE